MLEGKNDKYTNYFSHNRRGNQYKHDNEKAKIMIISNVPEDVKSIYRFKENELNSMELQILSNSMMSKTPGWLLVGECDTDGLPFYISCV